MMGIYIGKHVDPCGCGTGAPPFLDFVKLLATAIVAPINPVPDVPGRYYRAPHDVWRRVSRASFAVMKWRKVEGEYVVVEGGEER